MSKAASETAGPRLRTDSLLDSVVLLMALTIVQRLIGFCRAILFCRWLSPEQLGQWDVAFSFLMLAAPLSVLALSGSFGRYAEYYRQQGRLRTLLRRTGTFVGFMAVMAWACLVLGREAFARLIFGSATESHMVVTMAGVLVAVIGFHYMVDLFTGLRNARTLAGLHLLNSLAFAGISLSLLAAGRDTAESVVTAYGAACLISVLVVSSPLRAAWQACPEPDEPYPASALWSKLIPFSAWMWIGSFLGNLFDVADRYLIVHCGAFSAEEALAQVGNYHSSRVVPVLLLTIATLLGTLATPHLTHLWEQGRRRQAAAQLRLILKLVSVALVGGGTAVLVGAPLLFGLAFQNKFVSGQGVLPFTLTYYTWFGLQMVSQNWLWCHEKARLSSLALLVGLATSAGLNLVLLPRLGLPGAALGTMAGNFVVLAATCAFNRRLGLQLDRGTRIGLLLPLSMAFGPWIACAALATVVLLAVRTDWLLSAREKHQVFEGIRRYHGRLRRLWAGSEMAGSSGTVPSVEEIV